MNATISMEGLWQMIQSLSLNNQKWISDKLIENIHACEEEQYISKEEILAGINEALKEMKNGGGTDAWDFLEELKNESKNQSV